MARTPKKSESTSSNQDIDLLDIYYEELSRVTVLDKDTEFNLLVEYCNSDTSTERKSIILEQVVESNLKLVFSLAKDLWKDKDKQTLQDLLSAGNEGLILAINKFDPKFKVRLCTYAGHWIAMCMRKVRSGPVRVPIDKPGPKYAPESAAPEGKYSLEVDDILQVDDSMREALASWLRFLTSRERYIIEHSYGLNPFKPCSLKEIGNKLSLSSERVRQIRFDAIHKLSGWVKFSNID
jgi:RNA polymerase primary sigma factor